MAHDGNGRSPLFISILSFILGALLGSIVMHWGLTERVAVLEVEIKSCLKSSP